MIYSLQHRYGGVYHLIADDDSSFEICGTPNKTLLYSASQKLEVTKDGLFEIDEMNNGIWHPREEYKIPVNETMIECYCKKCLKKAINANK